MVNKKVIPPKKAPWTKILSIACVILVLALAYFVYKDLSNKSSPVANKSSSSNSADNALNNSRKQSSNPSSTLDNGATTPSSSSDSGASGKETPNANYQVQIVSDSVSEGNLHIGDIVNGTTTGTCTLTASKEGQSTLQLATSSVKQNINDYDCGVFNISTSQFPVSGTWAIELTVTDNGSSASASVNVNI